VTTIVFLHAHPDDESTQTSGAMARASAEGDRVVVVYATNGDHGDAPEDLADGETVVHRRRVEAEASAQATGTQQIVWLGYADSGMSGWDQNDAEGALHGADVDVVAKQLAAVLDEEDADVLVGYDWHGNYGHPDHVKVHHVAHRAAELAARRPRLLESTMNRTRMAADRQARLDRGEKVDWDPQRADGRREPARLDRGGDLLGGGRVPLPRAAARRRPRACEPGRHRLDAVHARRRVCAHVRRRVLHRARTDRADREGLALLPPGLSRRSRTRLPEAVGAVA